MQPGEFLDLFNAAANTNRLPLEQYADRLSWACHDMRMGAKLRQLKMAVDESIERHYYRVMDLFMSTYSPSTGAVAEYRELFNRIRITPGEGIEQFLDRYEMARRVACPTEDLHSMANYDALQRIVDPSASRAMRRWRWVAVDDEADARAHAGTTTTFINSWEMLRNEIIAVEQSRMPADAASDQLHRELKQESAQRTDAFAAAYGILPSCVTPRVFAPEPTFEELVTCGGDAKCFTNPPPCGSSATFDALMHRMRSGINDDDDDEGEDDDDGGAAQHSSTNSAAAAATR